MSCYKDKTFCPFYKTCKDGAGCDRALTEEVKAAAERWMKDAPICMFADKPDCYNFMPKILKCAKCGRELGEIEKGKIHKKAVLLCWNCAPTPKEATTSYDLPPGFSRIFPGLAG